jgi:1,4-alpha-glucan branching enzyme
MYEGPKKRYLKTACRVTFKLPSQAAAQASEVNLVGEFNSWDRQSTPMRKLKDGTFSVTVKLETGKAYRFRYLIDATRWENDWRADRYEPNSFGNDDSVVVV